MTHRATTTYGNSTNAANDGVGSSPDTAYPTTFRNHNKWRFEHNTHYHTYTDANDDNDSIAFDAHPSF